MQLPGLLRISQTAAVDAPSEVAAVPRLGTPSQTDLDVNLRSILPSLCVAEHIPQPHHRMWS